MSGALALHGLDAQNPLGFLAALGLLRVLDDHARGHALPPPRLAFSADGARSALVFTDLPFAGVVKVVLADARAQVESTALRLAYDDGGNRCAPDSGGATRDLKPPPHTAREWLKDVARPVEGSRRDADLALGFLSELVQDNNGNSKPTALHFTAGQQTFLGMVELLRGGMNATDLDEALHGPWRSASKLPSLSWDASVARNYALRASNPSSEKRGSVPAANWLAVQALSFFPVMFRRGRLQTTGVAGGWKDGTWAWPVWSVAATAPTLVSLLRRDPRRLTTRERAALGVDVVFESAILRSDQGGYGSFSPADVVVPPAR